LHDNVDVDKQPSCSPHKGMGFGNIIGFLLSTGFSEPSHAWRSKGFPLAGSQAGSAWEKAGSALDAESYSHPVSTHATLILSSPRWEAGCRPPLSAVG